MKRIAIKILLFSLAAVLGVFLTNDGGLVKIDNTAIITSLGIDYDEEENLLEVSAQIAVPQASGSSVVNTEAVFSTKGRTIGEALEKMSSESGWYPKLSFCNLVIVQKTLLEKYLPETINYLLYSTKIYDSVMIAASVQPAKELLKSVTPMDAVSSFAITKILLKNMSKAGPVYLQRAKDVAISLTGKSQYCLIPLVDMIQGNAQGSSLTEENSSSVKDVMFNANKTLVINKGKIVATLSRDQTLVYNLLHKKADEAYISVESEGKNILLKISGNTKKAKIYAENSTPKLDLELGITCYIADIFDGEDLHTRANSKLVPKEILISAENFLREKIDELIDIFKTYNCDYFAIKESLFKFSPEFYFKTDKDLIVDKTVVSVKVKALAPDEK